MPDSFIESQRSRQPVIGLALGGGGLRGTAHIGVLEVLRSKGLPIHMAAGTSAGSVIAMLHALGWTPEDMRNLLAEIEIKDLVDHVINVRSLILIGIKTILDRLSLPHGWLPPTPLGFVKGKKFYRLLCRLSRQQHFSDIDFPLFITATNLCNGRLVCFCPPRAAAQLGPQRPEVIFTADASLAEAVRASTAIPGIFEPLIWQGHLLVDGGLKNNVPADLLRWAGADIIIAVDLGFHSQDSGEIDTILEILIQSLDIMGQTSTELRLEQTADVVIQPATGTASLTDIEKVPGIIEAGRQAALEAWPQIALLVQNFAKRRSKVQPNFS
ncbi:MAG TPA: patatin [Firmicutes bacterium]|nr:patatin [Bacillota bacterium]